MCREGDIDVQGGRDYLTTDGTDSHGMMKNDCRGEEIFSPLISQIFTEGKFDVQGGRDFFSPLCPFCPLLQKGEKKKAGELKLFVHDRTIFAIMLT